MILWGGIYPGAKLGLREMPMLSFTYLRIILAMIVLFVVSGRTQRFRLPRSLWSSLVQNQATFLGMIRCASPSQP